ESEVRGLDKIVYLVGSAIAPTETTPSLLHHQQLQQLLFHVNGSTISDELANNICLALSRSTLWESYRSLFWADYDLTIFEMEDRK
ncbi:hypothetical protein TELCIR_24907, partial [Teladorsagia circumcincta]